MVDGSSAWAVTALAMPIGLAPCSKMANPAANIGVAGAMAMTPSAITPNGFQLKAPRLRIPWILLAIESVDGTCPPAGRRPWQAAIPPQRPGSGGFARKSIGTLAL